MIKMLYSVEKKFVSSRKGNFFAEKELNKVQKEPNKVGKEMIIPEKELTNGKNELIFVRNETNPLLR